MRVFRKATRPWGEWLSSKNSLGWHLGRRGLKIKTAFREGCPVQPEAFSCRCPGTRSPGRSSEPSGPRGCSQADPLLGLRMEPQVSTRLAKPLPGRQEVPRSARVSPREFPALLGPQSESDVRYHPSHTRLYFCSSSPTPRGRSQEEFGQSSPSPAPGPRLFPSHLWPLRGLCQPRPEMEGDILQPLADLQGAPSWGRPLHGEPRINHRPIYKPALIKSDIPIF